MLFEAVLSVVCVMPLGRPITVEVLAYAPTAFFHCLHCEVVWHEIGANQAIRREQMDASLPDDLKRQYQQLSDWVRGMVVAHGALVRFKVIDAASLEGWYKAIRHGVRKFPAVIVDGNEKSIGPDFVQATALIERRLAALAG